MDKREESRQQNILARAALEVFFRGMYKCIHHNFHDLRVFEWKSKGKVTRDSNFSRIITKVKN